MRITRANQAPEKPREFAPEELQRVMDKASRQFFDPTLPVTPPVPPLDPSPPNSRSRRPR